ncbi:MAG: sensor hybrid histidine kinase [Acidobacteria bacterium]|nr:sensor hybrid histidine kinase [Acidobacteriota bacterium]
MPSSRLRLAAVPDTLAGRIALGLLIGAAGLALRFLLDPLLGGEARYLLLAGAVVLAGWTAGYAGGLSAAALGIALVSWLPRPGHTIAAAELAVSLVFVAAVLTLLALQVARWGHAERQLRRREEDYRSLFESLPIGYCRQRIVTDGQGRPADFVVLEVNRAFEQLTGVGRADVLGRRITDVFPAIAGTGLVRRFGEVALGGGPVTLETPAPTLGRTFQTHAFAPQPGEFVTLFADITDRIRQEEQVRHKAEELESLSRAKDEFLATLSHELRTPMNAILGWSHMIASGKLPAEHLRTATAAIVRNAEAQRQLVEDVLDMSRIIRGQFQIRVAPMNLVPVLEKAVESVRAAADAKALRLRVVEAPGLPVIVADPERLQQVFWNLLSNAIKFTPAGGGEITIAVTHERDGVGVRVTDSGEGISAEFLPRVFERFSQADSSMTRAHGGLGLGLAIVRHLVELHGGTVSVQSEGPGKGASFHVHLPVSHEASEPEPAAAARAGGVAALRP